MVKGPIRLYDNNIPFDEKLPLCTDDVDHLKEVMTLGITGYHPPSLPKKGRKGYGNGIDPAAHKAAGPKQNKMGYLLTQKLVDLKHSKLTCLLRKNGRFNNTIQHSIHVAKSTQQNPEKESPGI